MQMLGADHVLTLAASKQQENAAVVENANKGRRNFSGQCCLITVSSPVGPMFFPRAAYNDGRAQCSDRCVTGSVVVW